MVKRRYRCPDCKHEFEAEKPKGENIILCPKCDGIIWFGGVLRARARE